MNNDYKISVIIPVYNAEEYLKRCLDSVLQQTFTDFEVLLINDGSKDSSPKICDEYSEHHKNFKVFHQENAGPSAARNKGIENAKGEYITFIDADDFVDPEYLDSFFILEKEPKNTVVVQGYVRYFLKNNAVRGNTPPLKIHRSEYINELFLNYSFIRFWPVVCGKLYSTEILIKEKIVFDKRIKMGEDLIFFLKYIHFVDSIITINKSHYKYLNSATSLTYSLSDYHKEILRIDLVKEQLDSLSTKFNFSEELNRFHYSRFSIYLYRGLKAIYVPPTRIESKDRIKTIKETKNYLNFINYKNPKGYRDNAILFFSKREWFFLLDTFLNVWYRKHYRKMFKSSSPK